MANRWKGPLVRMDECRWRIPESYKPGMRVPGVIYADESLLEAIVRDQAPEQVANVACLPGIVGASLAMPDIHWGYGFPIGGVAATEIAAGGVISPGGVGYDINCGVRLIRTELQADEVRSRLRELVDALYRAVPTGVGSTGRLRLDANRLKQVLAKGAQWAVEQGFGWPEDVEYCEERGAMADADPEAVSSRALKRGSDQLGTMGSGNHFLELSLVEEIYDQRAAAAFGLEKGQLVIQIHTGSRGLGHQVCTDFLQVMGRAVRKYGIELPDRQLACAPLDSPEGRDYFGAMAAAANYAWANRQVLTHRVREALSQFFGTRAQRLGLELIYDVAHNIAKIEEHSVNGKRLRTCVHRKGATRSFGPGHPVLPEKYREVGQPVLVPGDMGTNSYVLAGTQKAMAETFGSTCHGAGRLLSRAAAKRSLRGSEVRRSLEREGIIVRAGSDAGIAEEAPDAYKDVTAVVEVTHRAGISRKVAKLRPMGVIKG